MLKYSTNLFFFPYLSQKVKLINPRREQTWHGNPSGAKLKFLQKLLKQFQFNPFHFIFLRKPSNPSLSLSLSFSLSFYGGFPFNASINKRKGGKPQFANPKTLISTQTAPKPPKFVNYERQIHREKCFRGILGGRRRLCSRAGPWRRSASSCWRRN